MRTRSDRSRADAAGGSRRLARDFRAVDRAPPRADPMYIRGAAFWTIELECPPGVLTEADSGRCEASSSVSFSAWPRSVLDLARSGAVPRLSTMPARLARVDRRCGPRLRAPQCARSVCRSRALPPRRLGQRSTKASNYPVQPPYVAQDAVGARGGGWEPPEAPMRAKAARRLAPALPGWRSTALPASRSA